MSAAIEVRNLSHTYSIGTPFEHAAIKNISFSLEKGELLGIIGHTGSGKSTLMQHLNGLLKPSQGDVLLGGESIWKDKKTTREARFRVGLVFQYPEYQLFEDTVYKDIAFGPKNMGLDKDEIHRRVLKAAGFAGVAENLLEKSPFDLSGGQKRRVAIAGVIAMEPEIVIFDEPTAGLDPAGCADILDNIRKYQQAEQATILMVSHSMDDVASLAERVIVMNHGQVVMDGEPRDVFSRGEELRKIGLDVPQAVQLAEKLRERGYAIPEGVYRAEEIQTEIEKIVRKEAPYA